MNEENGTDLYVMHSGGGLEVAEGATVAVDRCESEIHPLSGSL